MLQKHLEKYRKKWDSQKEYDKNEKSIIENSMMLFYCIKQVISSGMGAENFINFPVIGCGKLMR